MAYQRKSEADLEQLAWDIIGGQVFGSWMIQRPHEIPMVFMVLYFLEKPALEQLQEEGITVFYEYMKEAAPRGINGMPCFFSVRYLDRQDAEILQTKLNQLTEIRAARMARSE